MPHANTFNMLARCVSVYYVSLLSLPLCWGLQGCKSHIPLDKMAEAEVSFCPAKSSHRQERRVGFLHQWCEDSQGQLNGPFWVDSPSGVPHVRSHFVQGQLSGSYKAFHPTGRRAIKAVYAEGRPVEVMEYWPPNGPSSRCIVLNGEGDSQDGCDDPEAVLARPFCDSQQIMERLLEQTPALETRCKPAKDAPPIETAHFDLQWWIELSGRAVRVEVSSTAESRAVSECVRRSVEQTRFLAPFGQPCRVQMPFQLRLE